MRSPIPYLHCDGEDGWCDQSVRDDYETGASTVNGVRVTSSERSPGWWSDATCDYCPEHATEATSL